MALPGQVKPMRTLMRHSKAEIYLHLVWTTKGRAPLLTPDIERAVHRAINNKACECGCVVLALGGMPDHVHMLVRVPGRLSASELANRVKGASSRMVNEQLDPNSQFAWQEGYGCFSISRSHLKRVAAYICNQAEHHLRGTIWLEWEQSDEPSADPNG